jgi:hypothetical protein
MNPGILRNLRGFFMLGFERKSPGATLVMEGQWRDSGGTAPRRRQKPGLNSGRMMR